MAFARGPEDWGAAVVEHMTRLHTPSLGPCGGGGGVGLVLTGPSAPGGRDPPLPLIPSPGPAPSAL